VAHAAAAALYVTNRAGVQPVGRRLSPRPRDFEPATEQPSVALVCRLVFSTPAIHVITWIITHLLTLEGWKAELAWLVDP